MSNHNIADASVVIGFSLTPRCILLAKKQRKSEEIKSREQERLPRGSFICENFRKGKIGALGPGREMWRATGKKGDY